MEKIEHPVLGRLSLPGKVYPFPGTSGRTVSEHQGSYLYGVTVRLPALLDLYLGKKVKQNGIEVIL